MVAPRFSGHPALRVSLRCFIDVKFSPEFHLRDDVDQHTGSCRRHTSYAIKTRVREEHPHNRGDGCLYTIQEEGGKCFSKTQVSAAMGLIGSLSCRPCRRWSWSCNSRIKGEQHPQQSTRNSLGPMMSIRRWRPLGSHPPRPSAGATRPQAWSWCSCWDEDNRKTRYSPPLSLHLSTRRLKATPIS